MKIKNLAFCGVMASILGLTGAYAADATIIASKAYVDARDNLKQDEDNRIQTSQADYEATTGLTDAQRKLDYPSMFTLKAAVGAGTSALDGQNADSSTGVSAGAAADNSKVGMPVVKVTETDGIVTSELGTIKNAGIASDAAITTNKMGAITGYTISTATGTARNLATTDTLNEALGKLEKKANDAAASAGNSTDRNVYTQDLDPATLAQVAAVQATIAQQGQLDKAWNQEFSSSDATSTGTENLYKASQGENPKSDEYVPTVAAVEKRIDTETATMTDSTQSATYAAGQTTGSGTLTIASANAAGNRAKFATSAAVASTATDIKAYTDDKIAGVNATVNNLDLTAAQATGTGEAVVTVTQTDGQIAVAKDKLSFSGAMNSGLSEINTVGGDYSSSCTTGNPCVLTMVMNNGTPTYEWTSMDTDSLTGQI